MGSSCAGIRNVSRHCYVLGFLDLFDVTGWAVRVRSTCHGNAAGCMGTLAQLTALLWVVAAEGYCDCHVLVSRGRIHWPR